MTRHNQPGPPCKHMKGLLNGAADGTAHGLALWYARNHASRCSRCGRYLETLETMVETLHDEAEAPLDPEVTARLSELVARANAELASESSS